MYLLVFCEWHLLNSYNMRKEDTMNIGIICPSEIALRRFMPALEKIEEGHFVGLAIYSAKERFGENLPEQAIIEDTLRKERLKANAFIETYGGVIFDSYEELVTSSEIDAVYIPLPPALHYKWAKKALENGKHVLVEKPSTISYRDSQELVELAKKRNLALHENYMFNFHNQLDTIEDIIKSGEIGEVRLYRILFGFPMRAQNDFRYNKQLGGGALFDAGGYTIKYATRLLGETAKICYAKMNYLADMEVDMYGSGVLSNDHGDVIQISFGMDNNYKCELEVWGSKGCLTTGRVLTAPAGFTPTVVIRKGNIDDSRNLPADDTFEKSIRRFMECITNKETRENNYDQIVQQAKLVDDFYKMAQL